MRTLSFTRRKASREVASVGSEVSSTAVSDACDVAIAASKLNRAKDLEGSPNAQTAAEPSNQSPRSSATTMLQELHSTPCSSKTSTQSSPSPSPMTRLRRMMRSLSDESLRAPTSVAAAPASSSSPPPASAKDVVFALPVETTFLPASNEPLGSIDESASTECGKVVDAPLHATATSPSDASPESAQSVQSPVPEREEAAPTGDVFLNASIQLLHVQSDVRQRIRQIWFTIQRLRWEGQVSDTGVELLHTELQAVMKSFSLERLDGARHLKTGHLTLLQAPDSTPSSLRPAKSFFGNGSGRRFGQRMWCTLSEEYGKFEMTPVRDETAATDAAVQRGGSETSSAVGESAASTSSPLAGLSNKLKLPSSLSRLLTDALQPPTTSIPEQTRVIKLHGCQVRKIPTASTTPNRVLEGDAESASSIEVRHQIQILVPNAAAQRSGATSSQSSYSIYTFEVLDIDGGEDETESWVCALDRVCRFHLYVLERSISGVRSLSQYRDVLSRHFPLCISLSWLRNRIDRYEPQGGTDGASGGGGGSNGGQQQQHQQQMFQYHQQQRRLSKNLSMIQVIKDLERDKVLVDQRLIATVVDHSGDSESHQPEQGNVSEVVKYVVTKVLEFVKRVEQRGKSERATTTAAPVDAPSNSLESGPRRTSSASSSTTSTVPQPLLSPGLPTSPRNRFTKYTEASALAFVERVLRGSSRTQSGGDIYDAISFFCQHKRVSICPVSQDACPVQMNIVNDDACDLFHVEIQVCMRFKVVEMAPMMAPPPSAPLSPLHAFSSLDAVDAVASSPRAAFGDLFGENTSSVPALTSNGAVLEGPKEWAVLEGTLTRQFTFGKLSEPGAVTIAYISHDTTNLS